MVYSNKVRNEIFTRWAEDDIPMLQLARDYGINPDTLWKWAGKQDWYDRKVQIRREADRITDENIAQVKARQRKICKAVQSNFVTQLQSNKKPKMTAQDNDRAMKHELLLCGEATSREEHVGEERPLTHKDLKDAYDEVRNSKESNKRKRRKDSS